MSDDDEGEVVDYQKDAKVYAILRDLCDSPRILFQTEQPLRLDRHGKLKKVILVCTRYFLYLIKKKGRKLYARWPLRQLSIRSTLNQLTCSVEASTHDATGRVEFPDADGHEDAMGTDADDGAGAALRAARHRQRNRKQAKLRHDLETIEEEFRVARMEGATAGEVQRVVSSVSKLAAKALNAAAILADDEEKRGRQLNGPSLVTVADIANGFEVDDLGSKESEDEEPSSEDTVDGAEGSSSDEEGGLGFTRQHLTGGQASAAAAEPQRLLQSAPSRYIAVTSLVDGEFADYATLRNAYVRKEDDRLLDDLSLFIKDNEIQVEELCKQHYPVFLHAARQCLSISARDAKLVGEELSGATMLVRGSVIEMKQTAAALLLCRNVRDNLVEVRSVVSRATAVVEYLETAELQVKRQQLIGAIASLRELVRLAAPLAEFAVGEYVLQHRVPNMMSSIFTFAVQKMNLWLRNLREQSETIGEAALSWKGVMQLGSMTKKIVTADEGDHWWVEEGFTGTRIERAPFGEAKVLVEVTKGGCIQEVFTELRRGVYFCNYYAESRAMQAKLDVYDSNCTTSGMSGKQLVAAMRQYCVTALGFILTEDIVHHSTRPHVQSTAEVLRMWDRISFTAAERARKVSLALIADENYADRMVELFSAIRDLIRVAVDNVKCIELSPLVLSRVVESMSDNLISSWLQECCVQTAELILTDTLIPARASSLAEYNALAGRFYLNRCPLLEFPIPPIYRGGTVELPYALFVPVAGDKVLTFLQKCYSIIVKDSGAVARQSELNNVDEMLLKYLSVAFRTVSELLNGRLMSLSERSVLQFATLITSSAAMSVVVSCAEQQFVLRWLGDYSGNERQRLGVPKLLQSSAALFGAAVQRGIEKLLSALVEEVKDRLRPALTIGYWKALVEVRRASARSSTDLPTPSDALRGKSFSGGFVESMDYALATIPQLSAVLQTTVLSSVVSTVIAHTTMELQGTIETAVRSAFNESQERDINVLRACVGEFELQCEAAIPRWMRRLSEVAKCVPARMQIAPKVVADEVRAWLDRKEVEQAEELARQRQILATLEGASMAVVKGVGKGLQTVGKTMTAGVAGAAYVVGAGPGRGDIVLENGAQPGSLDKK